MIGWMAWVLVFLGMYLIGNKNIWGFAVCLVGGVLVGIDAWVYEHWSLFVSNLAFMGLHVRNILKWRS